MVSNIDRNKTCFFEPITADDTSQQIKRLDVKATQESNIPAKLVRHFNNLIVDLQENFNNCLRKGTFLNDLNITISSCLALIRLLFTELGFYQIKRKYKQCNTIQSAIGLLN